MKQYLMAAVFGAAFSTAAAAATVDLSDNTFDSVQYVMFPSSGPTGPINAFTEVEDGVTFSFSTSGQFRQVGTWGNGTSNATAPWALQFGGSGGNASSFILSVSQDITLDSFSGLGARFNTSPVFDVAGPGVMSNANAFSVQGSLTSTAPATESFSGGPLSLTSGASYTFTATNAGPATTGFLTAFDFTTSNGGVTPVPLPAGLPLLLAGLGAFGLLRRRKT